MKQQRRDIVAPHMPAPSEEHAHGFFLACGEKERRIFCMHHGAQAKSQIIAVPPFAEEMNKSRRMLTLLAHSLKNHGLLIPDFYGTGDSEGDFEDARWEIWKEDLTCVCRYLKEDGATNITLLGLRLGALLAVERVCHGDIDRVILWQPVVSGNAYLTQFLRLRLAADMAADKKETTQALREKLAAGEPLEIAGYTLAPALACAIDAANMRSFPPHPSVRVDWMEISSGASVAPAARAVIDRWRETTSVVETVIAGSPFWTTSEITIVPDLITRTVSSLD